MEAEQLRNDDFILMRINELFEIRVAEEKSISKNDFAEQGYPVIHYGEIWRKYNLKTEGTINKLPFELYEKSKKIFKNEIAIVAQDFQIDKLGKALLYSGDQPAVLVGKLFVLKLKKEYEKIINLEWFSGYLNYMPDLLLQINEVINYGTVKKFRAEDFKRMYIRFPNIEEQNKVIGDVKILDKMSFQIKRELEHFENTYEQLSNYYFDGDSQEG